MSIVLNIPAIIESLVPEEAFFMDGTPLEIIDRLIEKGESKTEKARRYPLIALFHNIEEDRNPRIGIYADITVSMIICNYTEPTYDSPTRREKNFIPTLWPIYAKFIKNIADSGYFQNFDEFRHRKMDQYYWGKYGLYGREGNIFDDFLDAVEIKNLKLSLITETCTKYVTV